MTSKRVGHGLQWAVCSALLSAGTIAAAAAPRSISTDNFARTAGVDMSNAIVIENAPSRALDPSLQSVTGRQTVLVRMKSSSVAESKEAQSREQVLAEQAAFIDRAMAAAPSAKVIATTQLATNTVALEVDAQDLPALSRDTAITRIVPVGDYRLDLSETVPYIGGATAHQLGFTGAGVRIAVIDSGIDYTHAALGGPGTQAAYEKAWAPLPAAGQPAIPAITTGGYLAADPTLFPTAKVIGGYDYVGESWPNTDLLKDNNPIGAPDATTFGGHGTHVSDIIAGKLGVAPDAKLYAVKACSAPTSSCSGIALIEAMDFALDPNGDGKIRDRVDIINMSLGSNYGQPFDDDLSLAVDNASKVNVLTVASAGNAADKQFIVGSPSAATTALSVAQTAVPSAALQLMTLLSPLTGDRGAIFQPWSGALTATIEGPAFVAGATGTPKRLGCNTDGVTSPYAAGELAGKIVFVDRGTCSFSIKVANIKAAGGILAVIGVVTADAPFAGAYGGGDAGIPAFMINQVDGNILRNGNAVVRFSPTSVLSLAGSLASTSSRGPRFDDSIVKPEIGAPGASVSAMSGSFNGTAAFGGTSGAAPMVTGAAALVKQMNPFLPAKYIKQLLVNTAETNVFQPSALGSVFPDQLAPITRIGGGEVRVDRAVLSSLIVHDETGDLASKSFGAVSFGALDASKPSTTIRRRLVAQNYSDTTKTYTVKPTMRYQDDKDTGAVTMSVDPQSFTLVPGDAAVVIVTMNVDGSKLRDNLMNSSTGGNAIGRLTANEYDGYLVFENGSEKTTLPWHILPRKSADVVAKLPTGHLPIDPNTGLGTVAVENKGVGLAQTRVYSMLGMGTARPPGDRGAQAPTPDLRAVGINSYLADPGVCASTANFIWEFAFNTFERPAMPIGLWYEVDIDVNPSAGDGVDYAVYTRDVSGDLTLTDGRQATAVFNAHTGKLVLRTNSFVMEHATNSSNLVMRICGSDLGLGLADAGRPMIAEFSLTSWYWGTPSSVLGPFNVSPGGEDIIGSVPMLAYKQKGTLNVQQFGTLSGLTPNAGLLMINNSALSDTNNGGATAASEAILLPK